eukprot:gnl/TRDRNA2_/TRDRNA2_182565_c0_seq1.p1 gnl/TRDRNA2_/TRDRNA2_182565_c0~~gnl/TRDRNA2_/TRDRNA2_182565_c0_seq1.p1  ORF type:complete len:347 (+),score=47.45 gnl/TRDRNA2_/TRDRNA2_182565_c0_seq1:150-1190(+)
MCSESAEDASVHMPPLRRLAFKELAAQELPPQDIPVPVRVVDTTAVVSEWDEGVCAASAEEQVEHPVAPLDLPSCPVAPPASTPAPLGHVNVGSQRTSNCWCPGKPGAAREPPENVAARLDLLLNGVFFRLLVGIVAAGLLGLALGVTLGCILIMKGGQPMSPVGPMECSGGVAIFTLCVYNALSLQKLWRMFQTVLDVQVRAGGDTTNGYLKRFQDKVMAPGGLEQVKEMGTYGSRSSVIAGVIFDPAKAEIRYFLQCTLWGTPAAFFCLGGVLLAWSNGEHYRANISVQMLCTMSGCAICCFGAVGFLVGASLYGKLVGVLGNACDTWRQCVLQSAIDSVASAC